MSTTKTPPSMSRLATLAIALAAPLLVSAADPVKTRMDAYKALGASFKSVNDELRKPAPKAASIQLAARQISKMAKAQYGLFPAGTGPKPGSKTSAKPEIWSQPAKFKIAQDQFAAQATAFSKVAAGGDPDKLRVAVKALGQTCGSCHKVYRTDKS